MIEDTSRQGDSEQSGSGPSDFGESWDRAAQFAEPLGRVHTLFQGSIRALAGIQKLPAGEQKKATDLFPFLTLIRSQRMQAIVYAAALSFGLGSREDLCNDTAPQLLDRFRPEELQVVVALSYLHYKISKKVTEKVWVPIRRDALLQLQIGAIVGDVIPEIGRARAVFVGGARPLAAALLSLEDERSYVRYRTHLNKNELLYDIRFEEEIWNCNHLQILAVLFQKLGFGIESAKAFLEDGDEASVRALPEEARPWNAAMRWIEALLEDDSTPDLLPGDEYRASAEQQKQITSRVTEVEFNPDEQAWFEASKESLPKPVGKAMQELPWPTRIRKKSSE